MQRAIRLAHSSQVLPHRHAALLVRGGRVLASGVNVRRNSAQHWPDAHTHAEISALKAVQSAKGATLYVARVTQAGKVGLSAPCPSCSAALSAAGVKRVVST